MRPTPESGREPFAVPWQAWHADELAQFDLPAGARPVYLRGAGADELSDAAIFEVLGRPIDAPSLETLARGCRRVAIAIDDITRPTPTDRVLPALLDRLGAAGVRDEQVTVIIATGAHRPATARDLQLKLGSVYARVRGISHDPHGPLADTGIDLGGTPIRLNTEFLQADLRIGIGAVMPHPFAWFSGGAKIVIPGLADLDVVARSHRFAMMGFHGGHSAETNRFRRSMEQAVRAIRLDWVVGAVVDERRRLIGLAAGDLEGAHRAAATLAVAAGSTPPPPTPVDALVLNAYPKDAELIQMEAAFVALRDGLLDWATPTAPVILMGAATEGLGTHELFGPGGRLYRPPSPRGVLKDHPLLVFAPGAQPEDARLTYWPGYAFANRWDDARTWLESRLGPASRVGIVPAGPLQTAAPAAATRGAAR